MFKSAIETPVYLQWDQSSRQPLPDPGSAPYNCGPTSVTNIAAFYKDRRDLSIYTTRRLAVSDPYRGTSINEQQVMLTKRGVPCFFSQLNLFQIHNYVGSGRRPIVIGMDMSKVPDSIAGHPFQGWHAVEVLGPKSYGDVRGVLVRDPNFNRTYRTDPTGGQRFYPDWVIQSAFVNPGGWALVPKAVKQIVRYVSVDGPDINIRYAPPRPFTPGNVFARSRRDGIYRLDTGNRLSGLGYDFEFKYWRETDRGTFAIVRGYGRRLAIRQSNVHFV